MHESDYERLQTALSKLQDWSETWLLKLNIQKCKTVSYGRNVNKDYKYHMLQEGTKMIVQRDDHIKIWELHSMRNWTLACMWLKRLIKPTACLSCAELYCHPPRPQVADRRTASRYRG